MDSSHLLYLLYGGNAVYRQEAKLSILSALHERRVPNSFTITLMTDEPQTFEGWPVTVIALSTETLAHWEGAYGYTHRRKACAIAAGAKLADKTIFVDTDTVFFKDPALLFERISDQQYLMDEFEWEWAEAKLRADYVAFSDELIANGKAPDDRLKLYNSGICGMTRANAGVLDKAIVLIDEWNKHYDKLHTIEQIAVSFAMGDTNVVTANDCIHHYYSKKRFHHTMNQGFFDHHGERYHAELPTLSATMPVHFPKPSLLDKVKAQPRLIAVSKAFRPAAKLMIQGQKVATAAYLQPYCRKALWVRAIELLQQKHATARQIEHLIKICIAPAQRAEFRTLLKG
ncbi:hypothetical protein NTD86_19330 [Pseudomonas sp. 7P_10.2_Bac1]|uniref:hypothetical protein n=1 Tax=Pseudomonas sp. 7P_10.2_Bac1 TaxID=2971614 RepID=UPI0021CAC026|nr:hypothetical protein [Pseudomonas sp. 7P_10.2_Bac1]MCU1729133.1 hypothetical protein [Pseudomonas sp. 7P_10.2_Bac1]